MKQGNLNILKSAKMLLDSKSISKDVILMFDEMYLHKREEYAGGKLVGADADGNLYEGIVCFMIVGFNLTWCHSLPFIRTSASYGALSPNDNNSLFVAYDILLEFVYVKIVFFFCSSIKFVLGSFLIWLIGSLFFY